MYQSFTPYDTDHYDSFYPPVRSSVLRQSDYPLSSLHIDNAPAEAYSETAKSQPMCIRFLPFSRSAHRNAQRLCPRLRRRRTSLSSPVSSLLRHGGILRSAAQAVGALDVAAHDGAQLLAGRQRHARDLAHQQALAHAESLGVGGHGRLLPAAGERDGLHARPVAVSSRPTSSAVVGGAWLESSGGDADALSAFSRCDEQWSECCQSDGSRRLRWRAGSDSSRYVAETVCEQFRHVFAVYRQCPSIAVVQVCLHAAAVIQLTVTVVWSVASTIVCFIATIVVWVPAAATVCFVAAATVCFISAIVVWVPAATTVCFVAATVLQLVAATTVWSATTVIWLVTATTVLRLVPVIRIVATTVWSLATTSRLDTATAVPWLDTATAPALSPKAAAVLSAAV